MSLFKAKSVSFFFFFFFFFCCCCFVVVVVVDGRGECSLLPDGEDMFVFVFKTLVPLTKA